MPTLIPPKGSHMHFNAADGYTVEFQRSISHLFLHIASGTATITFDNAEGSMTLPVGLHTLYYVNIKKFTITGTSATGTGISI